MWPNKVSIRILKGLVNVIYVRSYVQASDEHELNLLQNSMTRMFSKWKTNEKHKEKAKQKWLMGLS